MTRVLFPGCAQGRARRPRATSFVAHLMRDTRGAIYVLGIVLGAVLFGAAWNLVNVGSAIAWRERSQDLADAAAFENALAHARGMNLLVMVNLVMVIVLSFLVIWRMLMLAMLALAIPTFGASLSVASFMSAQDRALSTSVHEFVRAGPYLQKVIALSTPHVAMQRAEALVRESYPHERVLSLRSVSASMFPSELVAAIAGAGQSERASQRVAGFGLGLPAEQDSWGNLCDTAAQAAVLRLAEGDFAVPGLDGIGQGLRQWGLDRATRSAPDPFCASWNGARDRAVSLATTACKTLGGGVAQRFCARVARQAVSPFFGSSAPSLPDAERPALLEAPEHLVNGNASAQSWSFVELDREPWLTLSRQGLEVMDGERRGGPVQATQGPMTAQFEMYFDCDERWSRCADDSLLRLAWRARGRVVNPALATQLLGGALELGAGRGGHIARGQGGELQAQLERSTRAALERALPEARSIRERWSAYGDAVFEQRLTEQARSLVVQGAGGTAPDDALASSMASAAARLVEGLASTSQIVVH